MSGLAQGRALWVLLGLSLVVRAVFAALLPLGTDEAYALAVGRSFSLSFFDHPPLGFWAPAAAEWVFGSNQPFVLRLPSLILGTVGLWGFYLCGQALGGEKVGLWTAGLAAVSPMVAFSGVMILPDAPLYPALIFTAFALIRLAQGAGGVFWAIGGVALGVALASKYQAGLLPIALLVWMVTSQTGRGWFLRPGFYLALILALIGLAPVLIWNISHDWASFAFHTGRAGGGFAPKNFALMALGQALYLLPPILFWCVMAFMDKALWRDPAQRLLALIGLLPIVAFNAIYLVSQNSLAHWTMAGWIMILPLVALRINRQRAAKGWLAGVALPAYAAAFAVALHLATGFAAGLITAGGTQPAKDNTAPLIPMRATKEAIAESGVLTGVDFIAATGWIEAGHLAAALGPVPVMQVLSDAPHHFGFMPQGHGTGLLLLITTLPKADAVAQKALAFARGLDPDAALLQVIPVPRGAVDYFAIVPLRLTLP